MLTPFGIAVRKLRLDKGMRLLDLAKATDRSSAFISAIETGRKQIPDAYLLMVARAMKLTAEEIRELRRAADRTRKEVPVAKLDEDQRELVAAFARKLDELPSAMMADLKDPYKIGVQSYKYIKAMGLSKTATETRREKEVDKAIAKSEKAVTSPMAYDKRPIAQAFKLTDAMKKDLYREMHGYAALASSVPEMTQ